MPIYTYKGMTFTEEEVTSKAEEKGLDLDTYINKFGIKREGEEGLETTSDKKPPVNKKSKPLKSDLTTKTKVGIEPTRYDIAKKEVLAEIETYKSKEFDKGKRIKYTDAQVEQKIKYKLNEGTPEDIRQSLKTYPEQIKKDVQEFRLKTAFTPEKIAELNAEFENYSKPKTYKYALGEYTSKPFTKEINEIRSDPRNSGLTESEILEAAKKNKKRELAADAKLALARDYMNSISMFGKSEKQRGIESYVETEKKYFKAKKKKDLSATAALNIEYQVGEAEYNKATSELAEIDTKKLKSPIEIEAYNNKIKLVNNLAEDINITQTALNKSDEEFTFSGKRVESANLEFDAAKRHYGLENPIVRTMDTFKNFGAEIILVAGVASDLVTYIPRALTSIAVGLDEPGLLSETTKAWGIGLASDMQKQEEYFEKDTSDNGVNMAKHAGNLLISQLPNIILTVFSGGTSTAALETAMVVSERAIAANVITKFAVSSVEKNGIARLIGRKILNEAEEAAAIKVIDGIGINGAERALLRESLNKAVTTSEKNAFRSILAKATEAEAIALPEASIQASLGSAAVTAAGVAGESSTANALSWALNKVKITTPAEMGIFASSMGGKASEELYTNSLPATEGGTNFSGGEILLSSALWGLAETVGEKTQLKLMGGWGRTINAALSPSTNLVNDIAKVQFKNVFKKGVGIARTQLNEQASEQVTNLFQNTIDKHLLNKNVGYLDNTGTVFKDTALLTGLMTSVPHIAGAVIKPFLVTGEQKQITTIRKKMMPLLAELQKPISKERKKIILKQLKELTVQGSELHQKAIQGIGDMSINSWNTVVNNVKTLGQIKLQAKTIFESSSENKKLLLENLQQKYNEVNRSTSNILSKTRDLNDIGLFGSMAIEDRRVIVENLTEIARLEQLGKGNASTASLHSENIKKLKDTNSDLLLNNSNKNLEQIIASVNRIYGDLGETTSKVIDVNSKFIKEKEQELKDASVGKTPEEVAVLKEALIEELKNSNVQEINAEFKRLKTERYNKDIEGKSPEAIEKLKKRYDDELAKFDAETKGANVNAFNVSMPRVDENGDFVKDKRGRIVSDDVILTNKRVTEASAGSLSSKGLDAGTKASHELLHVLFAKAFGIDQNAFVPMANALVNYIAKENPRLGANIKAYIDASYETSTEGIKAEELIVLVSELIYAGELKYNESFFKKVGIMITTALNNVLSIPQINMAQGVKLNSGKDVYDFLGGYSKSFSSGELSPEFKQAIEIGVGGKLLKGAGTTQEGGRTSLSKSVEDIKKELADIKENEYEYDDPYEFDQEVRRVEGELKRTIAKEAAGTTEVVKKETAKKESTEDKPKNRGNLQNLLDTKYDGDPKKLASEGLRKTPSGGVTNDFSRSVIGKELGGTVETITRRLYDPIAADAKRNVTRDEYKDALIQSAALLINNEFDASKQTLDKFISSRLNLRANALAYELGIEGATKGGIKKDVEDQKALMATETADQGFTETAKEKPKYKNALEAKVFPTGVLETATKKIITITRTLKTRIDAPVSLNKTVTPLISEIRDEVGKQLDIDVKTMLGGKKDGVLKKELLRTKRYVLENMTTTWLMGKDGQGGIPMAIQKQIDGKWVNFPDWVGKKIDREKTTTDQAGRTSGAELVRRLPNVANNISDEVFLAQIIGPDGNPIRGRKESLSKAMSEEGAFDIINADFAEGGPIFEAFATNQIRQGYEIANNTVVDFARQSDRGNVKFSKAYNNFTQIKKDIFNGKINQLSTALNPYLTTSNQAAIKRIFKNIFIDNFSTEEINGLVEDFRPWLKQMRDMYAKNVKGLEDTNFDLDTFIKNVATMHEEGVLDVLDIKFSHESLFSPANVTDARTTTINMFSDWVDKFGRVEAAKMMIYSGGTFKSNASLGNLIGIQINPETKKVEFSGKKGRKSNQITESAEDYWDNIVYNSLPNGRSIANQLLVEEIKKATSIQRKKDSASKAYKDRDFEGRKAQSLEYRKIVQETFSYYFNPENEVTDAAKAIMVVQMGSNMETAIRKSAILTNVYIPKVGIEAGALRYEHTRPASQVIAEILNTYKKGKGIATKEDLANIWDTYTAAVIPVSMDNNFNKAGFKSKMPPGWKKGMPTYYRYYNYATFGMKNMFAMESIDPKNKEIIGEDFVKASDNAVNGVKNDTKIKAVTRSLTSYSKTPKGISVFDFDDTVGLTSGSVLYTMPDGSTGKLNAEEFAKEGGNMLDAGAVFDFSEFSKVVDGKPGPMVEKMKKMIGKFGPENFFILTARPANAAGPIHEFLSSIGIDIPLENIIGLGSSLAQSKADWMIAKAAEGYNDFYFADDAIQNVEAVKKALDIPGVDSKVQQAMVKFSLTSKQDLKWTYYEDSSFADFEVKGKSYKIELIDSAYIDYPELLVPTINKLIEKYNLNKDDILQERDRKTYQLIFEDYKGGTGITGGGNAAETFGVVINGVIEYAKDNNIETFVFAAKEPSRRKLYNAMANVIANKIGWNAFYENGVYIVSKKGPIAEATTFNNQNSQVKDVLNVVDIKSAINQSKVKFSKTISPEFNKIIEENKGMEHYKVFSDIVARRRGKSKNKFDFYVPPSAADFELLLYNFLGKGKRGEEQQRFFNEALLKPYANGNDLMDAARQSIKKDYKALLDSFPDIRKKMETLTPDGDYTYDQAIRVAMWNEEGVEIPGISERDSRKLTDLVNNDPELAAFKQGLIVTGRQGKGWINPTEYWDANTIIADLHGLTEGEGRKKFLAEFIDNAEQMFGTWSQGKLVGPNINKVEAVYGTNVREAIEDVLYRMTTGKNRSQGKDKETSAWSNWVNGSTGAIMFLNTRSAALQLIGAVNFLNLRDNNPFNAGVAFLNQPQYWKDFSLIWNSDKMKERRGGLKEDVAAAEIASAAAGSKNKPAAVIAYLLKIGYTPTQLADSFAIASGGAPFYRNRVKSYLKEGQTQDEAEANAWSDFTKVSDETQQSGDPRDISKQQASGAGRLLLTFQNTAMQQSRIVKKSYLDLRAGRGNAKTHISKIVYYLAVQNTLFAVLQQGLFAVAFDDDDEELDPEKEKAKKKKTNEKLIDVADGVLDTILRGTGFVGGVVSVLKNMTNKYLDERDKNFKADYAKVMLEGANISPPIGSKLRKVYTGLQQTKFEKDLIKERGWSVMQDGRVHLGPMYGVTGKLVEATTNLPMDRLVNKIENVSQAMNSENQAWQRVAVGVGFTPYSVGIEESKGDEKIRAKAKETRAVEGKIKAKDTRERKKDSILNLPTDEYLQYVLKRKAEKLSKKDSIANLSPPEKAEYNKSKELSKKLKEKEKTTLEGIRRDSIAMLTPEEKINYNKKVAAEKLLKKKASHEKYMEKKKELADSLAGLTPRQREKYKADKKAERHQYYMEHKGADAAKRKKKKSTVFQF